MADRIESFAGSTTGIMAFLAWIILMPFASVDVANYGISVYTAFVLIITIGLSRRDRKAMHAKLDDLECAVEQADSGNRRLEELTEEQIEEKRL